MTKRRSPAQQIAFAQRQASADAGSEDGANGGGTHEMRRETHGGLPPFAIEQLKQLEDDYSKLKQIVAGFDID